MVVGKGGGVAWGRGHLYQNWARGVGEKRSLKYQPCGGQRLVFVTTLFRAMDKKHGQMFLLGKLRTFLRSAHLDLHSLSRTERL